MLQVVSLYSPGGSYDSLFLSNYATINVIDTLARVNGVGEVYLFGPLDYSMRIWLDSDRLTALGLTPSDVIAAIQSQNVQAAAGRIGAQPMADDQQFQISLQTQGRLSDVGEFEDIVVRANPDGSKVRVSDIGRVELGSKQSDSVSRLNGSDASAMAIYLAPGANAVSVATGIKDAMESLAERFPDDLEYAVIYDTTDFVKASLEKVIHTLFEAFIPGITGQLFQQFAAVVAFSMLISATNALTLSPALCAIFLKPTHDRRGILGYVMRGIDSVRDGYAYVVARLVRVALLVLIAIAGAGLATGLAVPGHAHRVPAGGGSGGLHGGDPAAPGGLGQPDRKRRPTGGGDR